MGNALRRAVQQYTRGGDREKLTDTLVSVSAGDRDIDSACSRTEYERNSIHRARGFARAMPNTIRWANQPCLVCDHPQYGMRVLLRTGGHARPAADANCRVNFRMKSGWLEHARIRRQLERSNTVLFQAPSFTYIPDRK